MPRGKQQSRPEQSVSYAAPFQVARHVFSSREQALVGPICLHTSYGLTHVAGNSPPIVVSSFVPRDHRPLSLRCPQEGVGNTTLLHSFGHNPQGSPTWQKSQGHKVTHACVDMFGNPRSSLGPYQKEGGHEMPAPPHQQTRSANLGAKAKRIDDVSVGSKGSKVCWPFWPWRGEIRHGRFAVLQIGHSAEETFKDVTASTLLQTI